MITPTYADLNTLSDGLSSPGAATPPGSTLVIGYGNDLRSDDGAGYRAATMIATHAPLTRVIVARQLTPDLADDIARSAQVVFIDAYAANDAGAPLRVERISADDAAGPAETTPALAHYASLAHLLALAAHLYGRSPDAWVVAIPAFCFAAGESISPATMRLIDQVVALLAERASCAKEGA